MGPMTETHLIYHSKLLVFYESTSNLTDLRLPDWHFSIVGAKEESQARGRPNFG